MNTATTLKPNSKLFSKIVVAILILCLGGLLALAILEISWILDFSGIRTIGILSISCILLSIVLLQSKSLTTQGFASFGSLLWVILVLTGPIMTRVTAISESTAGQFSNAVTGEVTVWVFLATCVLAFSVWRPSFLSELYSTKMNLLVVFGMLAAFSSIYSPSPLYSFSWAFKLLLIISILGIWSAGITDLETIKKTLVVIWGTFLILSLIPFVQVLSAQTDLFSKGRFGGAYAPTGISRNGASLFLLSVLVLIGKTESKVKYLASGVFGIIVLLLGVGKAAIVACFISGSMFFILIGKVRYFIGMAAALVCFIVLGVLLKVPMVQYLFSYQENDSALHLTGRVDLWKESLPVIRQNFLIGKGYVSSKFSSITLDDVGWDAGHMHNVVLEVLYNNGIIGLILILAVNAVMISSVIRIIKNPVSSNFYQLAVGFLSLHMFLIINSISTISFGGRPHNQFILFLTLFMLIQNLSRLHSKQSLKSNVADFGS